jgi:hypothetical protein
MHRISLCLQLLLLSTTVVVAQLRMASGGVWVVGYDALALVLHYRRSLSVRIHFLYAPFVCSTRFGLGLRSSYWLLLSVKAYAMLCSVFEIEDPPPHAHISTCRLFSFLALVFTSR